MFSPITAVLAADLKIAADAWSVFVVSATSRFHVEPAAGAVKFAGGRCLICVHELLQFSAKRLWKCHPVAFWWLLRRAGQKAWVAHVEAANATAFAVVNRGEVVQFARRHG
jgi:hypothetical protein